jgi:hypothetical protein
MRSPSLLLSVLAAAALVGGSPLAGTPLQAQARRAITWDDNARLRAVADPQLSPDGARVLRRATTQWRPTVTPGDLHVIPVAGGAPRRWPNDGAGHQALVTRRDARRTRPGQ